MVLLPTKLLRRGRDQAALLLARGASAGAQPAAIAACNSSSSASRYSLAMISALMVERRLPSHIAIACSQACWYRLIPGSWKDLTWRFPIGSEGVGKCSY